ncbi:MAG: class I SAM-dependent methyltransferase [Solirubrobacteraceae bacterium]
MAPLERTSIYEFVAEQAAQLPVGCNVIDIGAGEAPYRELFTEQRYVTLDRADTPHSGHVDLHGAADSIPAEDGSFDALVCTQVLEHVPEPSDALCEFRRVLRTGGVLIATVPFLWEEHETPFDYYRYTRYGIEHLLRRAGFGEVDVRPRTDCFTAVAQLLRNMCWAMGSADDGMETLRQEARSGLQEMADAILKLAPLDTDLVMPLGFAVRAVAGDPARS